MGILKHVLDHKDTNFGIIAAFDPQKVCVDVLTNRESKNFT